MVRSATGDSDWFEKGTAEARDTSCTIVTTVKVVIRMAVLRQVRSK